MTNIEYNKGIDAAYIRLRESPILESEELSLGVVADFDSDDALVGIEILRVNHWTLEKLKDIGYKFEKFERKLLGDLFSKFAAAFS
jgi:uncharacterized protein YuzE